MPQIKEKYVFSLSNFQSTYDDERDEPNFRIIKYILNTVDECYEFVTSEHVKNVLSRSLYGFLFVIKCINKEVASKVVSDFCETFSCSKELIVEVIVSSSVFARFMYGYNGVRFQLVDNNVPLSVSEMNFSSKSILDYELNSEEYKKFLEQAVVAKNPLSIRLFKCFDECDDHFNKHLMGNLVSCTCILSIRSFLELPLIYNFDEKPAPSRKTMKLLNYKYNDEGKTVLMMASEKNNYPAVELLCRLMNVNETDTADEKRTASDYTKSSKIVMLLLENDSRFPISFNDDLYKEVFKIVDERSKFHAAIAEGKVDAIQSFREQHPKLKFAFKYCAVTRTKSQSVLLTALINTKDNFKTVNMLLGNGFNWDEHELKKDMKNEISRDVLNRLHREQPSHINFLLSKCKIFPGKGQQVLECYNKIRDHLNVINKSDAGVILKLLEYSDSLSITVDFYNEYVTANPNAGCGFDGYTEHHNGCIYVNFTGNETFAGVLVHECCHLALHILFKNACKPYHHFDDKLKSDFDRIIDNVHEKITGGQARNDAEKILLQTFEFYTNKTEWPKELIARVPQLIVMGKTQFLRDNYPELLDFADKHILSMMKSHMEKPEHFLIKLKVDKLNDFLRLFKEIGIRKDGGVWTNCNKFSSRTDKTKLIECKCVRLYLADVYKTITESMKRNDAPTKLYIVCSVEDMKYDERRLQIKRIWDCSRDIELIVNCENYNKENISKLKLFKGYTGKFIVVGVDETIKNQVGSAFCESVTYTWEDIDESDRNLLFRYSFSFQESKITVGELISNNTDVMPLEKLVNCENLVIRRLQPTIDHYNERLYVKRNFSNYENVEKVLSLMIKQTFLLIDDAGSGKSITLAHCERMLKKENPTYWVIRKSLRELDHLLTKGMSVEAFLKLCVDQTDKDFQEKLVIELHKRKKVILLLDAAEEIVQNYEVFLEILPKLDGNVPLLVTAQKHLLLDLVNCLPSANLLMFEPFSKEDQIECVYRIFKDNEKSSDIAEEKLQKLADDSVMSFVESVDASVETVGIPLITRMLGEIVCSDGLRYQYIYSGIYELFVKFVKIQTERVNKEKREMTADEFGDDMTKDTNYIYARLALKYVFRSKNRLHEFEYSDNAFKRKLPPIDADDLKRSGLITVSAENKYMFDHNLFAEFFVAVFVVKCFRNKEDVNVAVDVIMDACRPALVRFIEGGFRTFQKEFYKSKKLIKSVRKCLEEKERLRESKTQKDCLEDGVYGFTYFSTLFYLLDSNAYFSATFLAKSLPLSVRKLVLDGFDGLFAEPHRFSSFFLTAMFTDNDDESIARTILTKEYTVFGDQVSCIFQHIFLRFPTDQTDVIMDNTDLNELLEEMHSPKVPTTLLPFDQRFKKTTLKLLVDKAKDYLNAAERTHLLKFRNDFSPPMRFEIGEEFFEDTLNMQLLAMKELDYPFTSWPDLLMNTKFEGIIFRIFGYEEYNRFIVKFYRWASEKRQEYAAMDGFQDAVGHTFVRYFWKCRKNFDASELLQFIRNDLKIDITALLKTYAQEIIPIFSASLYSAFHQSQKYFTPEEFEQLVITNDVDGVNLVSEYICRGCQSIIGISPMVELMKNTELVQRLRGPLNASRPSTLCKWIFSVISNTLGKDSNKYWHVEKMFEIITILLDAENLKKALQFYQNNQTVFHEAAKHQDLFMMKIVWRTATGCLIDSELEALLTEKNSSGVAIIRKFDKKMMTEPPNIYNVSPRAAFEFIDWEDLSTYLLNVPSWNDEKSVKSFHIGLLRNAHTNEAELYEIVYNNRHNRYESYALIGYKGPESIISIPETSEMIDGMKVLVGNGFKWMCADADLVDRRDLCFMYDHYYISFTNGHISFVKDFSVNALILLFTDYAIKDGNSEYLYHLLPTHRRLYLGRPINSSMDFERDVTPPTSSIPSCSDLESDSS